MVSQSLSILLSRKATVNLGISNSRAKISALEDKISRLKVAIKSLDESLISLEGIKEEVDNFEVAKSKWQGETERIFIGKYNSYGIFLNIYKSDTEEAREQIEESLQNAIQEKGTAKIGLDNLEGVLVGLESDIKMTRETV